MNVVGWRCATCFAELPISTPMPFRCPNATFEDRRHVLQIVTIDEPHQDETNRDQSEGSHFEANDTAARNSFIDHDRDLAWAAFAAAHGMTRRRRDELVGELDDAIRAVDGIGFTMTPFARSAVISDELGFSSSGGVWVKDETGGVAGSQKARFLFSILLHLRAAEELGQLRVRPPLAIASCGNAALAAAILARAADWPLDVFVPTWMGDGFGDLLDAFGARVHRSARRDDDPPGDPAMLRFREAVSNGSVPFTVQGPENALCLDGGRTLGWEICEQLEGAGVEHLDRLFIQVGGGAFAAAVGIAVQDRCGPVALYSVQTAGCAPLERAWRRSAGLDHVAGSWAEAMTVWDDPVSLADGILDDETYDWVGVVEAMRRSGGEPVIAPEHLVVEAHELARRAGFDASPTGTAGLAGLLARRADVGRDEQVAVVVSGVAR